MNDCPVTLLILKREKVKSPPAMSVKVSINQPIKSFFMSPEQLIDSQLASHSVHPPFCKEARQKKNTWKLTLQGDVSPWGLEGYRLSFFRSPGGRVCFDGRGVWLVSSVDGSVFNVPQTTPKWSQLSDCKENGGEKEREREIQIVSIYERGHC